jgi:hypothetical protein
MVTNLLPSREEASTVDLFDKLKAGSAAPLAQPHWDEAGSE